MLQSCSPSHDWFSDSEQLLFDDEFCQSLMKDLQSIPSPPQSPPTKAELGKLLSKEDQLELVSEILLEDSEHLQLIWNYDFAGGSANGVGHKNQLTDVSDDILWHCLTDKAPEDKLSSVLSTSPLLSDIDDRIFEEIAGSTLDCHAAALACQSLEEEDLLLDTPEQSEASSDYGSLSAGGESSTSDSEEEIDVVTVRRSSNTLTRSQQQQEDNRREQQRALKRCHLEIQQQHNYAAPRPASPPPAEVSSHHKRSRSAGGDSCRLQPGRSRLPASRQQGGDTEDEEERRRTHNVMERQRRNELKNCFMRLRDNVPELSNNEKASKVVILKKAKDSIRTLEAENHGLSSKKERLRARQEQLRSRLEQLKRH